MVKLGTLIKASTLLAPGMLLLGSDLFEQQVKKFAKKLPHADRKKLVAAVHKHVGRLHKKAKGKLLKGVRRTRDGLQMVDEVLALIEKSVK